MGADTELPEITLLRRHPSQCVESLAGPEFRALASRYGIARSRWEVAATGIARTLRQLAPWHDLVVMERDLAGEDRVVEVLGEALLACKVPCILLPAGPAAFRDFQRVVVAWDGSMEATRSLHASLPLLRSATKVVLLDGFVRSSEEDIMPSFDPCDYLSGHGIGVRHQPIHADASTAGSAILEGARLHEADIVVMGAYGHSTLRERVLSGATRYMLRHAGLPLFMLH
jgi:nucleotide-binding universal stress UspA family protein